MVPNLEATDVLPDHGEAWRLPWQVLEDGVMRCRGRSVPWELQRRIEVGDEVMVRYRYTNIGPESRLAYWCAHPLFRYEPEMQISLGVPRPAEGESAKVFLPSGSIDRVELRWPSGSSIEMAWDAALTPDVAVWVCNGDLGGYRQIAIEPATSSTMLESGAWLEWWMQIRAL
jgi:hypothetical protein